VSGQVLRQCDQVAGLHATPRPVREQQGGDRTARAVRWRLADERRRRDMDSLALASFSQGFTLGCWNVPFRLGDGVPGRS
jgi:hypothetical protein